MPRSEVSICNLALREIGIPAITALTDASQPARDCNVVYSEARDDTLRMVYWNFAMKRLTLTAHDVPDEFGDWGYAYDYPADCLKIRCLLTPSGTDEERYQVFMTADDERIIVTNISEAVLEYTAQVTNPNYYDSTFVEALALKLAEKLAVPLRQNPALSNIMAQKFQMKIDEAAKNNRQESKKPQKPNYPWFKARMGTTNDSGY